MNRPTSKLTYSNVVSTLCLLLIVGGGTAYAAAQLEKESVGANQLKKGAVTPAKLSKAAKKTLTGAKGATGATGATGPAGAPGAPGPKGDPGSAKAWVLVSSGGGIVRSSGNVSVSHTGTGTFCVAAGAYTTANSGAVATADFSDPDTATGDTVVVSEGASFNTCPAGQFEVVTTRADGEELSDSGFYFLIG